MTNEERRIEKQRRLGERYGSGPQSFKQYMEDNRIYITASKEQTMDIVEKYRAAFPHMFIDALKDMK